MRVLDSQRKIEVLSRGWNAERVGRNRYCFRRELKLMTRREKYMFADKKEKIDFKLINFTKRLFETLENSKDVGRTVEKWLGSVVK